MPNPFPGMNPYLEKASLWYTFHNDVIMKMADTLNEKLPENYVAQNGTRVYVMPPESQIVPDITLLKSPRLLSAVPQKGGSVAVLETVRAPEIATFYPEEYQERFVEIRDVNKKDGVVTVIELLSPANKTRGHGREEYLRKQENLLKSNVNLLEIDLLRRGQYTLAIPQHFVKARGAYTYLACLHRISEPYQYEFWRIGLKESLPHLRVPLANGDPDVLLDVQAAFNRTYDAGRYQLLVNYNEPPVPPLKGEDASWAETILREKGLRTNAA